MTFQIAGLRWRLAPADEAAGAILRARYGAYAAPAAMAPLRALDLVARTFTLPEGEAPVNDAVALARDGDRFTVERLDFRGSIDLAAGRAEVAFTGLGGVQSFLRIACSLFLAPLGGVLVHSCSVVRGERAYLFVGESGAGKTTIARLSAPSLILSDEVSCLVPTDDGGYACHATPFWGDLADDVDADGVRVKLREEPAAAPLAKILFPRQATRDALVAVSHAAAFVEMAREAFVFGGDDDVTMSAITATCGRVVERVPACELHFRKSPAFWSLLSSGDAGA